MARMPEEEKARSARDKRRNSALRAEERAVREENKRREWQEAGAYLTIDELRASVHCRGCGLSVIDGLGSWPPRLKMDEQQRQEYEAADAEYQKQHGDCASHRWSMANSRTQHCGFCCPPPPLGEQQIMDIRAILSTSTQTDPSDLDTWRLTLTCDHVIEKTQHRSNAFWSHSVERCPDCGQTRGTVEKERLPPTEALRRSDLRIAISELEQARTEHAHLQKQANAASRWVNRLSDKVAELHNSQPDDASTVPAGHAR